MQGHQNRPALAGLDLELGDETAADAASIGDFGHHDHLEVGAQVFGEQVLPEAHDSDRDR